MPLQPKHPLWIRARIPSGPDYADVKRLVRRKQLHTVCEEARCPNIGECWESRTATFMILGDVCTRRCMFCAVAKGNPIAVDEEEPRRIGEAIDYLQLKHVVITSVNRDDLPDGGAQIFAACIRECRKRVPRCSVEVLIPDLLGNMDALAVIVNATPDVLNHNTETVPRLYRRVRPQADYQRTLSIIAEAKAMAPDMFTKSGLMVGLGEKFDEIIQTMQDLREHDCDLLTIGQYLPPSRRHLRMRRYYTPGEFDDLKTAGEEMGFIHVESGPLVRSSYHAQRQIEIDPGRI